MNLSQAWQKVVNAIREDATELNLSSIEDKEKLTDSDLEKLLPQILKLTNLEMLNLSNNRITKFDKQFIKLQNLQELDLSSNRLSSFSLEFENLRNLKELDLRKNKLPFPDERLNSYGNPRVIFDFIYFKTLISQAMRRNNTKLMLSNMGLSDADLKKLMPNILKLKNLQLLYLAGNKLTEFSAEFAKLKKLQGIYLSNNKLNYFDSAFAEMEDLSALDLSSNRLRIFGKEFTKLKKLKILDLRGNSLPFPAEILSDNKNPQKILNYITDYYKAKEAGNLKKLNEAKLVVIGESNVGKTCIVNRLIDNKFIKTDSTHGIQIRRWENVKLGNKEKVQMNVWDFGGQEIMHSTHQFFFTKRTVYILVINARENEDTNKTEEWLQRIQNLSGNSPVFIVGNKIDENNRGTDRTTLGYFDIERKRLFGKFPSLIKGIYGVSSDVNKKQYDVLFDEFKATLILEIEKLKNIHDEFPENWFEVKAELEKMQKDKVPYISFQNYITRCVKADIEKEESQRTLIEFMHDLGIALSFQEDKELRDLAVLNPEWVTRGVYALIDNSQITLNKGVLKREDISNYLNENEYPLETQDFIIKMMRKFRLLIDIQYDKTFLIPDLLPKDEPETGSWNDTLHFLYSYEIYEKSIIRRFIVEMFHLNVEDTYWRNGIVIKRGNNRALIKADAQDKTISIKIDGNPNTRREFIAIIRNKLDEINSSFMRLPKEMVGHPKYPQILRSYERLIKMEVNNIELEFVEELELSLRVKDWLNGVESLEERQKRSRDMENNKLKFAENLTINAESVNLTQQERGKVEINQNKTNDKFARKIVDDVLSKMDETQKQTMEKLTNDAIARIEQSELSKLNVKQTEEFEDVKKGNWETKLKFVIPLIPKIPFLEGFLPNASIETTRSITTDEYISTVQRRLYGEDLQVNILQDKN